MNDVKLRERLTDDTELKELVKYCSISYEIVRGYYWEPDDELIEGKQKELLSEFITEHYQRKI
jgi:hypothetical protein